MSSRNRDRQGVTPPLRRVWIGGALSLAVLVLVNATSFADEKGAPFLVRGVVTSVEDNPKMTAGKAVVVRVTA